ncbi:unnamed protein product [Protopolystoma xenopodis]|uniref:Uncharacterized protein n=1 Tax=Protopolystoma xenopodis TaxID=117903 RepID=A0A3S4ZNJ6_9PLAT|nr:unnamed protein product [Protopolystoma xenopodis]
MAPGEAAIETEVTKQRDTPYAAHLSRLVPSRRQTVSGKGDKLHSDSKEIQEQKSRRKPPKVEEEADVGGGQDSEADELERELMMQQSPPVHYVIMNYPLRIRPYTQEISTNREREKEQESGEKEGKAVSGELNFATIKSCLLSYRCTYFENLITDGRAGRPTFVPVQFTPSYCISDFQLKR